MRILLIDDDMDDREIFAEAAEATLLPLVCTTTSDGRKALALLNSDETALPDIIFLDINMPGMSGWKTLALLKESESCRHIPVVMYSTSTFSEDIEKARQQGAVCFFTKPSDFMHLKNRLEAIIQRFAGISATASPASAVREDASMYFF